MLRLTLFALCFLLTGCNGALGDIQASGEVERGLSYVACAIVTHAIIGAIFRD